MNRISYLLLIAFAIQVGVVITLYRDDMRSESSAASSALIDTGSDTIEQIQITDYQDNETTLRRAGERWLLPDLDNLPADPERVSALLDNLTGADPGWAVGHSLAARQRFQVADYHFRRKLVLSAQGREVATVFLGTSPSFRKIHARNAAADNIYAATLNLFELPASADKWLDPRLLQLRAPVAIDADGYSLRRADGAWKLGSGATPDARELSALLDTLRTIQVQGLATPAIQAVLLKLEAELILHVQGLAGEAELKLFKHDDTHYIASSQYPYAFVISAYDFDRLIGIDSFLLSSAQ